MGEVKKRKTKVEYYLDIAEQVASRGTCLRRNYGAVIVKNDDIISTGYTGAPRGMKNCCDCGNCEREKLHIPSGQRYELCKSVHAEMNAIISASRNDMLGSTLYLVGIDAKTGERLEKSEPCSLCKRIIINAGIRDIICASINDVGYDQYSVPMWVLAENMEHGNVNADCDCCGEDSEEQLDDSDDCSDDFMNGDAVELGFTQKLAKAK